MKRVLWTDFQSRYTDLSVAKNFTECLLLDPRFKYFSFLSEETKQSVTLAIKEKVTVFASLAATEEKNKWKWIRNLPPKRRVNLCHC